MTTLLILTTVCDLYYDLLKQSGGVSVSDIEKTILEVIQNSDNINTKQISELLNISRRTVERYLAKLKEEHLIEFRGVPKNRGSIILKDSFLEFLE